MSAKGACGKNVRRVERYIVIESGFPWIEPFSWHFIILLLPGIFFRHILGIKGFPWYFPCILTSPGGGTHTIPPRRIIPFRESKIRYLSIKLEWTDVSTCSFWFGNVTEILNKGIKPDPLFSVGVKCDSIEGGKTIRKREQTSFRWTPFWNRNKKGLKIGVMGTFGTTHLRLRHFGAFLGGFVGASMVVSLDCVLEGGRLGHWLTNLETTVYLKSRNQLLFRTSDIKTWLQYYILV